MPGCSARHNKVGVGGAQEIGQLVALVIGRQHFIARLDAMPGQEGRNILNAGTDPVAGLFLSLQFELSAS